jgi:putative DNA primase/helicase
VIEKIIAPMLDQIALRFDGGTSEAGIRQTLEVDARPILYDEAEAEDGKDRILMQGVLQLARRASNGGRIVKGGQGGDAVQYAVNTAFCFSAINPAIKHRADESRISQLVLRRAQFEGSDLFYRDLSQKIRETITPEYGQGMIRRTIEHLPTLLHNAEVFSDAAADVLCDRRAADQIGAMLAGLFLLTSTKKIVQDQAEDWIRKNDWTSHTAVAEQSDPERLITYISTQTVRYKMADLSIGELISRALGDQSSFDQYQPIEDDACKFLRSMGIWVRNEGVLFANKSPPLDRLLRDTPWVSWSRSMNDIPGATKVEERKFATGLKSRGVLVPLEAFGL